MEANQSSDGPMDQQSMPHQNYEQLENNEMMMANISNNASSVGNGGCSSGNVDVAMHNDNSTEANSMEPGARKETVPSTTTVSNQVEVE